MHCQSIRLVLVVALLAFTAAAQNPAAPTQAPSRRISFATAQKLLAVEAEGNVTNQPGQFTRTRLSDGRVLELYYPLTKRVAGRKSRTATAPGYALLYASEVALKDATRPQHMLAELIPDGRAFLEQIAPLTARLGRRVGTRLDYSSASIRRLDGLIAGFHGSHTTAQTDPRLFQELTAYYGETLRRVLGGEWRIREERVAAGRSQIEPNLGITVDGRPRELKPWSSIIKALYDEESRGVRLSHIFAADLAAAKLTPPPPLSVIR